MTSTHFFEIYEIFKSKFGEEKARGIVRQVDQIIEETMKNDFATKDEVKEAVFKALIEYFEKEVPFLLVEERVF